MPIQSFPMTSDGDRIDLGLSVSGLDLRIEPGTVVWHGRSTKIDRPITYSVKPDAHASTTIYVWLGERGSDHKVNFLIDSVVNNGSDVMVPPGKHGYPITYRYARLHVEAGETDLANSRVHVRPLRPVSKST